MNDVIRAMDLRAQFALRDYIAQHTIDIGTIEGVTLAGASIRLAESGRFLTNVPAIQGVNLVVGDTVIVARIGRAGWMVIGAAQLKGDTAKTTKNLVPVAAVQNLTATAAPGRFELRWTASFFDIRCYEIQINTSASETGATTMAVDDTQFLYAVPASATYYARVRAVGPEWKRGSWSAWVSAACQTMADWHASRTGTEIHVAITYLYADATAREAASLTSSDVGKLALQQDNQTLWALVDDDPMTWKQITNPEGDLVVAGDIYLGLSSTRDGAPTEAGYGNKLWFRGGPDLSGGSWAENSDLSFIARYDVASDSSEVRICLGDNNLAGDALCIGIMVSGVWTEIFRFACDGSTTGIGGGHDAVTLGASSAPELTLSGQELTLAAVVSEAEHTKAAHDALGINADQVDGVDLPGTIAAVLTNHTKAVHDALGINADLLDGYHAASFSLTSHAHAHADLTGVSSDQHHAMYQIQRSGTNYYVVVQSDGTIVARLGDAAGSDVLRVADSSNVAVFEINSDGKVVLSTVRGVRAYRTTNQTIATGTWTALSFNATGYNYDGMWSAGAPTRLYAPRTGIYHIGGAHHFVASSAGDMRSIALRANGSSFLAINRSTDLNGASGASNTVTADYYLASGNYIEIMVYQDSGGNLDEYATDQWLSGWMHQLT